MDIMIRGMEMPKSCSRCFCMASCRLWKNIMHPEFNRHRNCPLVPVPPHGRLIDVDAIGEFPYNITWISATADEWGSETLLPSFRHLSNLKGISAENPKTIENTGVLTPENLVGHYK